MLKLIATVLYTYLSVMAVFIAIPCPFAVPTVAGIEEIASWTWNGNWWFGVHPQNLQVLVALLAGLTLGATLGGLSQILYLGLGFSGLAAFTQGGGWTYWQQPTMGYLLALAPAAVSAAWLAGRSASLGRLLLACCSGILLLQALGLSYVFWITGADPTGWRELTVTYLLVPLPGQLLQTAAAAGLAGVGRRVFAGIRIGFPHPRLVGSSL